MLRRSAFRLALVISFVHSNVVVAAPMAHQVDDEGIPIISCCYSSPLDTTNGFVLLLYVILFLFWIYTVAVMIERFLTYRSASKNSRLFLHKTLLALSVNRVEEAHYLAQRYPSSPLAKAMEYVLQTRRLTTEREVNESDFYVSAQSFISVAGEEEINKGLASLQQVGWLALALGCLGTAIGVIDALRFSLLFREEGYGAEYSSALIRGSFDVLFFSLAVALPALWMQKKFTARANELLREFDLAAWELLNRLLKNPVPSFAVTSACADAPVLQSLEASGEGQVTVTQQQ